MKLVKVTMRKEFQFRIYPNKNQEVKLNSALSTCRHLYNNSLSEKKRHAEINNLCSSFDVFPWGKPEWINYYDQRNTLPDNKNQYQKELHSHVLQNVLRRVDIAFKNFFRGNGYPGAEYAGKTVELVDPKGTSQVCICGCSAPKKLSMRIHNCPKCGLVLGRDHVSAMVIESRGSTAGTAGIKACPGSLSIDIMKQEAHSVRKG